MNYTISQLNEILTNFTDIQNGTPLSNEIIETVSQNNSWEGHIGLRYEVYAVPNHPDLYIKFKLTTDSYGDNETITGIEFVKPTTKTVTVYEKI